MCVTNGMSVYLTSFRFCFLTIQESPRDYTAEKTFSHGKNGFTEKGDMFLIS